MKREKVVCTTCGEPVTGEMKYCAMVDRCISSQNDVINQQLGEKVYILLAQGQRVYVDEARPLCWSCWSKANGICAHCDLERAIEAGTQRGDK